MSDQFVAEIRIFPFNFPPTGWAFCDGQLMPISQNTALFSLLGVTYGGDGKSTFGLPNMQGNAPMQQGQGAGLSLRDLGETGGEDSVTLLQTETPAHSHAVMASGPSGTENQPNVAGTGQYFAAGTGVGYYAASNAGAAASLSPAALSVSGGGQPHNNMQPYLTLNFCIALQGIFPARS